MKRYYWSLLSFVLLATLGTESAWAQAPGQLPGSRPPVSPYLNLIRRGSDPAINYYDLVRPQFDVRNSLQQLQQQVTTNQQPGTSLEGPTGTLVTGHSSRFLNVGGYFMRTGTPTAGTGVAPAARATAPAGGAARR